MLLQQLTNRKQINVLGMNSGTSVDSLDMAVVRISHTRDKIHFLEGCEKKFPAELKDRVNQIISSGNPSLEAIMRLDNDLGVWFGCQASKYIAKLGKQGTRIHLVASHGQTVRHLPEVVGPRGTAHSATLQIGSPDLIARQTGLVTVADFRQADIAAGGEGAPITTAAMERMFRDKHQSRLIVNIGGISNFFFFPSNNSQGKIQAADCGPGNCLCDALARRNFDCPYDRGGRIAASGKLSQRLLSLLLAQPFFANRQKSTGREQFGKQLIDQTIRHARKLRLKKADIMRTLAELTTLSIATSVWPLIKKDHILDKLYLTGGGRHNKFFIERLSYHLPDLQVVTIDELGVDGNLVEAAAYAVMGQACLCSRSQVSVGSSRSRLQPVCGHIVQPSQPRSTKT